LEWEAQVDFSASIEAPQALGGDVRQEGGVWGKFLTFWLKVVHFGVYSHKNIQFIRPVAGFKKLHLSDR